MNEVIDALAPLLALARAAGAEMSSRWFYVQAALIVAAAAIGFPLAALARRRIDLVSLTMGWPPALRRAARALADNLAVAIFIAVLTAAAIVVQDASWPSRSFLLWVGVRLAAAWLVIRVVASQIRNKLVHHAVAMSAWLIAALSILGILDDAAAMLEAAAVRIGDLRISALLALKTIALLIVTLWLATSLGNFLERRLRGATDLTPSLQVLTGKLVKLFLFAVTIVVVLTSVGIDLSALVLFSSAVGVGIGFGLQKIVSNFVSGVILLADKSIKPGDVIALGESFGWVDRMGARYCAVVTRDGREFLIPNEDLVTQQVINWTHSNDRIRIDVTFGVGYGSDPHLVRRLAVEATAAMPRVLDSPAPVCHLTGFGDFSIDFVLRFWIRDATEGVTNVRGAVMLALWDAFQREGIEWPYPVRDMRMTTPVRVIVEDGVARARDRASRPAD